MPEDRKTGLLTLTKLKRVAFVGRGANQLAHISLVKSADEITKAVKCTQCGEDVPDGAAKCPHCGYDMKKETPAVPARKTEPQKGGGRMPGEKDKNDPTKTKKDEGGGEEKTVDERLSDLETKHTETTTKLETAEKSIKDKDSEIDRLKKALTGETVPEVDPVVKHLKDSGAAEEVIKAYEARVSKAEKDASEAKTAADEAVKKALHEENMRLDAESVDKVSPFTKGLPVDAKTFGPLFRKIEKAEPEAAKEIERVLRAASEAFANQDFDLTEIGKSGGTGSENDPMSKLEAKAAEIKKAAAEKGDPLSDAQSMDRAMEANPELVAEYRKAFEPEGGRLS